ncbi:MAG: isoprenylcysteine carboxylmethyltransferase family protein, partial [Gammaproteobacteria bacterium]
MKRALCLAYGIACYLAFQAVFLYLLGFLANFGVPKSIDGGASASPGVAIGVDIALIALFGLQHSIMARPAFKRRWTRWVSAAIERNTYVLATALVLALLFAAWIP